MSLLKRTSSYPFDLPPTGTVSAVSAEPSFAPPLTDEMLQATKAIFGAYAGHFVVGGIGVITPPAGFFGPSIVYTTGPGEPSLATFERAVERLAVDSFEMAIALEAWRGR